jgi:ABC-2 type transport system permease protein
VQLLPKAFLKISGVDQIDFGNILHFFAMQGQIWIFLFATFYLTRLSSSIFVKEEDGKTIEFIFSRESEALQIQQHFLRSDFFMFYH